MALLDMSLAYPAYPDKERAAKETMEMEHLGDKPLLMLLLAG